VIASFELVPGIPIHVVVITMSVMVFMEGCEKEPEVASLAADVRSRYCDLSLVIDTGSALENPSGVGGISIFRSLNLPSVYRKA
jgi:hypothetical protein